ncbi:MAG: GDSL-type esterase/lipase family protein [Cyanobacteria bacterium P01_E01_bin.35]
MPTLVCLGDSITAQQKDREGVLKLTPRLQQSLPNWKVINSGVPGDNTKNALNRLQTDVLDYHPNLVTVLLGTADASENKGIKIQEYEDNLTSIVKQITPQKTLLITSPPIDQASLVERRIAFSQANFVTMQTLEKYVQVALKVAHSTGSHWLDLWSNMRSQLNYLEFLKVQDGVHFNQQGYEFFAPMLSRKIRSIENLD